MKSIRYATQIAVTALAVMLTACGGGGGQRSTAPPPHTEPPEETITPPKAGSVLEETTGWFENTDAGDLAKHWHVTVIPEAIWNTHTSGEPSEDAATKLNTIARISGRTPPDSVQLLGRTSGYDVGRWVSGPADHTPIRLKWKIRDEKVDEEVRTQSERAAKMWSHHLSQPYEAYTLPNIDAIAYQALDRNLPYSQYSHPDGPITYGTHIEILAAPESAEAQARGYPTHFGCGEQPFPCTAARQVEWIDPTDGMTVLRPTRGASRRGEVYMHPRALRNETGLSPGWLMAHELGHVFYLYSVSAGEPSPTYTGQWWGNPGHATTVYGGPIPHQSFPGGQIDETHWADSACPTLMAYGCAVTQIGPSRLDVALLEDYEYNVASSSIASANEMYSLGAWGEVSAFEVSVERDLDSYTDDEVRASASAYGTAPASTLHAEGQTGTARWNGLILGTDLGSTGLPPVIGDATLTINLETMQGNARFTNLVVLVEGTETAFRSPTLAYDVNGTRNTFRDLDGYVQGAWYGNEHQEAAGTVLDQRPNIDLSAAFGASRTE